MITYSKSEDSHIIKVAKLILILLDDNTDNDTKIGCIKLDIKNGIITQNEAIELLVNLQELKDFV